MSYEQALGELERIVAALESEERPLEDALALYERGQILARYCAGLLDNAELKVQQLSGENLEDFQP
jgi:exodeoxyribonuclease VII small subunit